MLPAENALLDHARAGDKQALAAIFRRHDPELRAAVQKRLPQRWQSLLSVDDVVQQTYLDALLAIHRFKPTNDRSLPAWLRKLAEHNLIEAIRALEAKKRDGQARNAHSDSPNDSVGLLLDHLTHAATFGTPSRHLARADRDRLLHQALARLPEHYRKIVRQYDLEGRPMDAIAAELGRSIGATHLMRVRAHERLRSVLSENLTDFQSLP